MQRRTFIASLLGATLAVGPAFAASYQDEIINQLAAQGFTQIKVSRTWLGRLRIVATNEKYQREIVVNPNTGEILRDYLVDISTGRPAANVSISSPPEPDDGDDNSGTGGSDDDSDDNGGTGGGDDDSDDNGGTGGGDDDSDDNGGSGGGDDDEDEDDNGGSGGGDDDGDDGDDEEDEEDNDEDEQDDG